jgi:hypothetical protein
VFRFPSPPLGGDGGRPGLRLFGFGQVLALLGCLEGAVGVLWSMNSKSGQLLLLLMLLSLGGLVGVVMRSQGGRAEPVVKGEAPKKAKLSATSLDSGTLTESPVSNGTPSVSAAAAVAEDPALAALRQTLEGQAQAVPGEVILTFKDTAALKRFAEAAKARGLTLVQTIGKLPTGRFSFAALEQLHAALQASPDAPSVEPNLWHTVPQLPKEDKANQGGARSFDSGVLASIGAGGDRTGWGSGVTVAVLDTGVKAHPTFGADQITRVDLVGDQEQSHSHGTSVASLISGVDSQAPGVAPAAKILDVRVANGRGMSVSSLIADGIYQALDRGAQVINISMGGEGDSPILRRAVNDARDRGAWVVAAAGNETQDALSFPAAVPSVISVGSVDAGNRQAYFSNSGQGLDITAPGVGLTVAWDTDKLARASGTSHSTGLVSGAIAAMLSRGYSAADIERQLKQWATPTGAPTSHTGAGVLNLSRLR